MNFSTGWRSSLVLAVFAVMLGAEATPAAAQATGTIRGRVTDAKTLRPLSGAQVSITGTSRGSLTSTTGEFLIVNVPAGRHTVRVQMIGYSTAQRQVTVQEGETEALEVELGENAIALDEVVVTGTAGQARRREVGNSISQVKAADVIEPVTNVGDLLQGRAAGMNIVGGGGSIGSGSSIRLRGNTSVALSNQPLIYIDGVRVRSDAYPKNVPGSGYQGRSANVTPSPLDDINPDDIDRIEILKGAAATTLYGTEAAAGVIQIFTKRGVAGDAVWTAQVDQGFARLRPFAPNVVDNGRNAQYLFIDPWLRNGHRQGYTLSVQGGSQDVQYFVSGGFDDNAGVLPLDREEKYSVRGNLNFRPIDKVQLQVSTSYTNQDMQQTPAGNNAHGLTLNAFRRDRNYFGSEDFDAISQTLEYELNNYLDRFIIGGTVNYAASDNFANRLTVGLDRADIEMRNLRRFGFFAAPFGIISDKRWTNETITFDYVGNFNLGLTQDLTSTFSWGAQSATSDESEVEGYSEGFPGPGDPTVSSGSRPLAFERRERVTNAGFFLQNMLGFRDRYFITGGLRVDGNSAFGEDFGLQMYPKISGSWVLSEEPFWQDGWGDWKLRAAYGQAGRAPGAFDAVRTWRPVGWGGQAAFEPLNLGNPNLGPERTAETEVGFDASLLNGRLGADFTYFYAKTTDALFAVRQMPSQGNWSSQLENVGELESRGMELVLNADLVRTRSFGWDLGVSVSTVKSKVLSLGGAPEFSLGSFGWVIEGQPAPVIRADRILNPNEVGEPEVETDHIYGPNQPTHTIGLNSMFQLPYNLRVSVRGEYLGGHFMYDNASYQALSRAVRWPTCFDAYDLIEASRESELTAEQRGRCIRANINNDFFIYPADYFKLRDVTLQVPLTAVVRQASSATLSLSASNWYTWKKDFPVFDPEMTGNEGFNSPVRSISEHIPAPAMFTASLRFVF